LTQPDRLPTEGDREQWAQLLRNKKYQLGLGYFVTKQPASYLDSDFQEARREEVKFFRSKKFKVTVDEEKLGTDQLRKALSSWLLATAHRQLPTIRVKIEQKLSQMHNRLQELPEPHAEPRHEVHSFVQSFMTEFNKRMGQNAQGEERNIWTYWAVLKEQFESHVIEFLRPKCTITSDLALDDASAENGIDDQTATLFATPVIPSKRKAGDVGNNETRQMPRGSSTRRILFNKRLTGER
jgi:Dynamin central region